MLLELAPKLAKLGLLIFRDFEERSHLSVFHGKFFEHFLIDVFRSLL